MASAKSIEAGFLYSTTDTGQDEYRHGLEHGYGVQCPRRCEPPAYAASNSMPRSGEPLPTGLLPFVDFTSYRLQAGTLSADETTRTTTDPGVTSNAESLYTLLREQAAVPPKPVVRIKGTHIDYVYSWGTTRTDFDLALDMMPLIVPTSTTRLNYVNIKPNPGDNPADPLRSWVQSFCDDPAECKSLTLERLVTNWDTEFLERMIRLAVLSTKYKGNLKITFPITNSRVVIVKQASNVFSAAREHSDTSGKQKRLGRSRSQSDVADQFTAASFDDAMTYRPIQAVWPYATSSPAAPSTLQSNSLFSTAVESRYAVQSERDWWRVWKEPIRNGVLAKKHGWVTAEDWKDVILGQVQLPEPNKSWGTSADDWHLLMKGIRLRGSKRAAPGDIVKRGVR